MPFDLKRDIVLRWEVPDPALVPLFKDGGIDVVVTGAPAPALEAAGIRAAAPSELEGKVTGEGVWPGISRGPSAGDNVEIASASSLPWLDGNGYLVAYLRALHPDRFPALAYLPDERAGVSPERMVAYDTLELALAEAWVNGGNYVLAVERRYREALVKNDARAMNAWRQMGKTAQWLKENRALFGRPLSPEITALVDSGEPSAEIAKLLYRQSASPALEPAASPPAPEPSRRLAIVAASLLPPEPPVRDRILAHAEAGAIVVTDGAAEQPWWRVPALKPGRVEPDRETYHLGRGRVVAYKDTIVDPSEFALDVIDLVTHAKRSARLWNANSVIATFSSAPRPALAAVNYGSWRPRELMARVRGNYSSAVMLRPEAAPLKLKTSPRGGATDVFLPELRRVGVVLFE
jgi:hypothetical protein